MQGPAQPVAPSRCTASQNWGRGGTVGPLERSCAKQRELRDQVRQRAEGKDTPACVVSKGSLQGRGSGGRQAGRRQAGA